ncbi:MAG: hypothetical protein KDD60_02880 [Bdellovibrionales bacterium]|nr:hypothetical protein [Bdellovibrionales bacterium]
MLEITPKELKLWQDEGRDFFLLDVREPHERDIVSIGGELIPMGQFQDSLDRIPKDKPVVIYCRSGGRSAFVVQQLVNSHGYIEVYNLAGGVLQYSDDVDPDLPKY